MPRKAKEQDVKEVKDIKTTTTKKKSTSNSKTATRAKKDNNKTEKRTNASKKITTEKIVTQRKSTTRNTVTKKITKKTPTKKTVAKKEPISVIEYYDLPYRYNQTIVKILAQTPKMLFVYWDIADSDRKAFEEHYGNDFFSKTKPVLIVRNTTMNYSFEMEINDFANSWYLHVNDADCKYEIELGRRPLQHIASITENYIYVSSSNEMHAPNNRILFEKFNPNVQYKNVKNGKFSRRDFSSLANFKNMQEIYSIYDLYKLIYKDDLFDDITSMSSSHMESNRS